MEDEDFLHTTQARKCLETIFFSDDKGIHNVCLVPSQNQSGGSEEIKVFFGKNKKEYLLNSVFGDQMDETLLGDKKWKQLMMIAIHVQ